jgi:hypothetical protein
MAFFEISYTDELWNRAIVEAKNEEEAREKFWSGDFDKSKIKIVGGEIQESIDIEELDVDEDLP